MNDASPFQNLNQSINIIEEHIEVDKQIVETGKVRKPLQGLFKGEKK